jgi:hypothetical protein
MGLSSLEMMVKFISFGVKVDRFLGFDKNFQASFKVMGNFCFL